MSNVPGFPSDLWRKDLCGPHSPMMQQEVPQHGPRTRAEPRLSETALRSSYINLTNKNKNK